MTMTTISTRGRVYPRKFDHDEARRLHAEGHTYRSLAERYSVSAKAIQRVVSPSVRAYMAAHAREWVTASCDDCGGDCFHNWSSKSARHDRVVCRRCADERRREEILLRRLDPNGDISCGSCGQHRPANDYRLTKHGYPFKRCRTCETASRTAYRHSHIEEDRAYMRQRYAEGKR